MKLVSLSALLLASTATGCLSARDVEDASAQPSLDLWTGLAGSWSPLDASGQPTGQVTNVFRVTAGGTAVEETVFPGTDHEMVTLYFVRDGVAQLTHYCTAGNQPHMRARPGTSAREIAFVCDGSGVASEKEPHMHDARLTLLPDGRLASRWQMIEDGAETHLAEFTLARVE
jgi:hypothetical protein